MSVRRGTRFQAKLLGDQLTAASLQAMSSFVAMLATQKTSSGLVPVPNYTVVPTDTQMQGDIFLDFHMSAECQWQLGPPFLAE